MGPRPRRIGLFGNFGVGTFGNEASLASMLAFLQHAQPDAEITCVCPNPEKVQGDYKIQGLPISWQGRRLLRKFANWVYAFWAVRRFDLLIMPGTGMLTDFCSSPFAMPYGLFRWCVAAKFSHTAVAFVSVGASAINHPLSRWFVKSAASMAQYRSYRDASSKEFMKSLGVDTQQDLVYPDLVFRRLPVQSPDLEDPQAGRITVGVGVMAFGGLYSSKEDTKANDEYQRKLAKLVLWLLDRGYRVRLLMGGLEDQGAVDRLRKTVAAERPRLQERQLIAESAHSVDDVMLQTAGTDIVIGTRYHTLIFALILGKPTISVGYTNYHTELMTGMGLGNFCQQIDRLDVDLLIGQFTELVSKRYHYETLILHATNSSRQRLSHQDSLITSRFF
jgi:polysaccharide pyruvyl transferase WcaK-like protein